jgi:dienelactone hydrolase
MTRKARLRGLGALMLLVLLSCVGLRALVPPDALAALPRAGAVSVLRTEEEPARDGRQLRRVVLRDSALGDISLAINLPHPPPARPLPVVFVLGGHQTGQAAIDTLGPPGENVLVGYDWPIPRKFPRSAWEWLQATPALRRQVLRVPGQVSAALAWLQEQPWADDGRVSLAGFSLGAIAAPAIQRVAAAEGRRIGWTVLGYGGAGLGDLLSEHPAVRRHRLGGVLARAVGVLLHPIDPAWHLPALQGRFLVIAGRDDRLISQKAVDRFRALTPEPKEVVLMGGDHPGTGSRQQALLQEIVAVTRAWLVAQGAVNPR